MSIEKYSVTIRLEWEEDIYDPFASATLTISPAAPLHEVSLPYKGDFFIHDILPDVLAVLENYLSDSEGWVQEYIEKGPASWQKLQQINRRIEENKQDAAKVAVRFETELKRLLQDRDSVEQALEEKKP